jgi:PAS domain S-box-containing protein
MRFNLPISDVEYPVKEGEVLVSKTDLKGNITYSNKTFCEVSGYLQSELAGQPHNIIRHPDMPQSIFADCWEKISAGYSWHGIIKNRRKNGDYYWVNANISPLFENNEWTGYISLRYKPEPGQIALAEEHYHLMREGNLVSPISHKDDDRYIGQLQHRLAEKIVALEEYNDQVEQEQKIASRYMNKLIAVDKLQDYAVQFYLKPAERFSGDLIAIARTPGKRLHLMLADSTGHGLSAALAAMPMIHPFYSMTEKGFPISAIAEEINKKVWISLPSSHFVAAIIVSIDQVTRMVEVWSGGCPPPFIINDAGELMHQFKSRHLAMGILPPEQFDSSIEYFSNSKCGNSLVMFSDGVVELENENGEQFGLAKLMESMHVADETKRWEQTIHAIESFCGSKTSGADDMALMVAECEVVDAVSDRKLNAEQQINKQIEGSVIWQFSMTLTMQQLQKLDVVPLFLDIVSQVEKGEELGGELFMILSELFNNALDHGILKLNSSLKHHEDGMEKYFDERAARLANSVNGHIKLNLEKVHNPDESKFLRIRVLDSGDGFDYAHVEHQVATNSKLHGRGIPLLYSVCRSVEFMSGGAEVLVEFELHKKK